MRAVAVLTVAMGVMVKMEEMVKTVKMDVVVLVAQRGQLGQPLQVVETKVPVVIKVLAVFVERKVLADNKDPVDYVANKGSAGLVVNMDPVEVLDLKVPKGYRAYRDLKDPLFHRLFYM